MNITPETTVKMITRAYFVGGLAASATHTVEAAHMSGLTGAEALSVPFLVDGVALLGLVMRGRAFSTPTKALGMRVQMIMGAVSMIINVYAAHTWGGVVYGMAVVGLYMAAEWLSTRLESAATEEARNAAQRRSESARQAAKTRAAKRAAENKITKAPNVTKIRKQA